MIGVVLWSDPKDRKAVFWCEDQGDLAYFDGADKGFGIFDAGDMVQFDVATERKMRRAENPRLVHEQACYGLQDSLRSSATSSANPAIAATARSNVVQFATR